MSDFARDLCRRGCELLDKQRFAEAREALSQARAIAPLDPYVHYCLAVLHGDVGDKPQALAALDTSLALDPGNPKAHNNRGSILQQLNRLQEAEAAYRRAWQLAPTLAQPYINLGNVLEQQGRKQEAVAVYEDALAKGLDDQLFGQILAALVGSSPSRSPDSWVKATFDNFAPTFDAHLLALQYAIPAKLAALLQARSSAPMRILDLGCGTGQVGAALAGGKHRVVGVDLSERMVAHAKSRGVYESVHVAEVHEFVRSCEPGSYDAVCAADVFIYIGDLADLFALSARALTAGGLFAFSIEETTDDGYKLLPTGRYAQSDLYVRALAANSFDMLHSSRTTVRMERGSPVEGHVYLLRTRLSS